ncbi:MAG: outer membrane protein assembly factor BamE [Desulfuromonadales bacterium]|jgi:predicted small secreted protein|nr:outer membrane protein assembly factor BamE [Desulfuromonadales bacterium]
MRAALTIALLAASLSLAACSVNRAMQGQPGADVSAVRSGITRTEVEECLGSPLREWTTAEDVHYRVYAYDGGIPPSASNASTILFLDVISAGLAELFLQLDPHSLHGPRKVRRMAVAYDRDEQVIGVFDDVGDFDVLPDNGRSERSSTVPAQ